MGWLSGVLQKLGALVDAAVPVAVGARTKVAVIACPVLSYISHILPTVAAPLSQIPGAAPVVAGVVAVLPHVQSFLCGAAGAFALAGLVRPK